MLYNLVNGDVVAHRVKRADTFVRRLKGLMFQSQFPADHDALLITPCNAVHTMFMRYPIDVVFLDKDMKVLYICEKMLPGRLSPTVKGAVHVVELASGSIERIRLAEGDMLYLNTKVV